MLKAIVGKDLLIIRRESPVHILLIVGIVLLVASALAGLQREQVFAKEKAAAEHTDKAVWMNQGDRNPHSAAHFSRYAFRPASPLALIDPGTGDFAGLAVWMEAHYQDPAAFRRAEDSGELGRYVQLTPAFLFLTIMPMLVFLVMYASVAGEREDGTLRQLLAGGVGARDFFIAKLSAGLQLTMALFSVAFLLLAAFALTMTPAQIDLDTVIRTVALFGIYALYIAICVVIALAVSAVFRTRQAAFLSLTCVWAVMTVLVPRLAVDVGAGIYPQPDAPAIARQLKAASDIYYADKERRSRIEREVLDKYGVDSIEALPINYGAYVLQVSEELSIPEFERVYDTLEVVYQRQEGIIRGFSILSPAIATTNLSRGLSGTDRIHQKAFTVAAELHRREMIKMLNEDYMYNADGRGSAYTANVELWEQFEDFEHSSPTLAAVWSKYFADALLLLMWLSAGVFVAYKLVIRAARQEVSGT